MARGALKHPSRDTRMIRRAALTFRTLTPGSRRIRAADFGDSDVADEFPE